MHLDIELTNNCNLNCEMCPFHGPNKVDSRKGQMMDFKLYKKIIDEGSEKGLVSVKLNYGGEPLLYSRLIEAIRYAKEKKLEVQLNTNGTLLNALMCLELLYSRLDLLILTDYDIESQHSNLTTLNLLRDANDKHLRIRVKTNHPEKWLGTCDEIVENKYHDYCNLHEVFKPSKYKCTQPWQRFLVLVNGTVYNCSCGLVMDDKIIGNAWKQSLEDLWHYKPMKFLRYAHENGESHLIRQCRMCPARNEFIKRVK
ncbi:MAG: radical SAM protein [Candidatus Peregrinibacteria bacterium]|nr:radical SAM protein [Candidatus Peregrinibacteria bacterium]